MKSFANDDYEIRVQDPNGTAEGDSRAGYQWAELKNDLFLRGG